MAPSVGPVSRQPERAARDGVERVALAGDAVEQRRQRQRQRTQAGRDAQRQPTREQAAPREPVLDRGARPTALELRAKRASGKPARASARARARSSKWVRWRGRSRWYHAPPNSRRCQEPKFGTLISTNPPGRSAAWTAPRSPTGSWVCSSECWKIAASNDRGSSATVPSTPSIASSPARACARPRWPRARARSSASRAWRARRRGRRGRHRRRGRARPAVRPGRRAARAAARASPGAADGARDEAEQASLDAAVGAVLAGMNAASSAGPAGGSVTPAPQSPQIAISKRPAVPWPRSGDAITGARQRRAADRAGGHPGAHVSRCACHQERRRTPGMGGGTRYPRYVDLRARGTIGSRRHAAEGPVFDRFLILGRQTVVYGLGGVALQLIGLLTIPIFTRVFDANQYGVLETTIAAYMALIVLADLGITSAAQGEVLRRRRDARRRAPRDADDRAGLDDGARARVPPPWRSRSRGRSPSGSSTAMPSMRR